MAGTPLDTLLEFTVDEASGDVTHISTATSQSAVRVVLQHLFCHAARNGAAARLAEAVEQFHYSRPDSDTNLVSEHMVRLIRGLASQAVERSGDKTLCDDIVNRLAAACADTVAPAVWCEMDAWIEQSSLNHRHAKVMSRIFGENSRRNISTAPSSDPALVTFVEYDQEWRNLGGLPNSFVVVSGRGNASVAFDSRLFGPLHGEWQRAMRILVCKSQMYVLEFFNQSGWTYFARDRICTPFKFRSRLRQA